MVVDKSALIALMRNEPNFQAISKCISEAPCLLISAVSVLEARIGSRTEDLGSIEHPEDRLHSGVVGYHHVRHRWLGY
jgi:uncharacterized protein with PIN domain